MANQEYVSKSCAPASSTQVVHPPVNTTVAQHRTATHSNFVWDFVLSAFRKIFQLACHTFRLLFILVALVCLYVSKEVESRSTSDVQKTTQRTTCGPIITHIETMLKDDFTSSYTDAMDKLVNSTPAHVYWYVMSWPSVHRALDFLGSHHDAVLTKLKQSAVYVKYAVYIPAKKFI